ncbi:restriction endonuclease [Flavobacterium sp. H122]|uniref:restriction endonuclease n=1 Tax=Flavobacterium sp. H122 TaxID=2529860 RepID=UPI0010A9EC19|nr:restriction endonuclease [Flavobacterium sp. H122]
MKIVKHSGDIVDFDVNKLHRSLLKSGTDETTAQDVIEQIKSQLYEGISTKKIYKLAFELLKKDSKPYAARYNLRASLEMLGPAGFYFEKYVSMLFRKLGYQTRINLELQGRCVTHEVDVALQKDNQITMVECKFHSNRESVSDVKVPMYILSRFNDLRSQPHVLFEEKDFINKCLIVTNNRFTEDAAKFAVCSGLELLSWDLPKGNNLRNLIDTMQLYPITCLTTLSVGEKEQLLMQQVILVNQLRESADSLEFIGLSPVRIKNILKEVKALCN